MRPISSQRPQRPGDRWRSACVVFCHSVLVLIIGVLLWRSWDFQFHNNFDIVGWVSAHQYPKQRELIAYVGAFGCVILGVVSGWFLMSIYAPSLVSRDSLSATSTIPNPSRWPRLPSRWRVAVVWILIPILLYLYLYDGRNIHGAVDLFHEGERLAPLNSLLRDGIPFRDIYIQHGLFQNVGKPLLAAKLGTPSLASLRAVERLIVPVGYLAFYLLGLQVFRSWLTAVALILFASSQSFWVSDRHALGLLAVAALVHALHHRESPCTQSDKRWWRFMWTDRWILVSGLLTTLAFFYSTEVGLYTFAAAGLFLGIWGITRRDNQLLQRWLPLSCYVIGALSALIPFVLYFGWYGALDDLIRNTFIQTAYQIPTWGLPYPSLLPALREITSFTAIKEFVLGETFRWYFPGIVYLIATGVLTFRAVRGGFWTQPSNAVLFIVLLEGVLLFRTALGRSDFGHLIYGSTLFWVFLLIALESSLAYGIRQMRGNGPSLRKVGSLLVPVLVFGTFGWYVYSVHHPLDAVRDRVKRVVRGETFPRTSPVVWDRLGALQIEDSQRAHLQRVVAFIQQNTRPEEPIFDFSSQGAYYFFADRPSATRYHQIAYAATPAMQREVIRDLEQTRTRLVIYRTGGWFDKIDGIPATERHPLIARYLDKHYTQAADIDGTVILLR